MDLKTINTIAKEYTCEPDSQNRRPISVIDCQIISNIQAILKLSGGDKQLMSIINQWKKDGDDVVLDELLELKGQLEDFVEERGEQPDLSKTIDYIQIKDEIFIASFIAKIKPIVTFGQFGDSFGLLINEEPIPDRNNWLKDKVIYFKDEEERDCELRNLKNKLQELTNVRFL